MTMTSRDYAALSEHAYEGGSIGRRGPTGRETIYLNANEYNVVERVNHAPSGYQGTLYQRVRTGDLIVAHRGTEEIIKDGIITDASMLLARSNPQAPHALALTARALVEAEAARDEHGRVPQVTVTGHSLGGTLAQITAHHHNLRGETFNAYGAVALTGHRVPEGGSNLINHVMATDPVSAASRHFGEVKVYATDQEMSTLSRMQFSNSRFNGLIPDYPLNAAALSVHFHSMRHFSGPESVLDDRYAEWLAGNNTRMIDEYRDDIRQRASAMSLGAMGATGVAIHAYNKVRGPLEAGEPARREAELQQPAPPARIDQRGHPGHSLFKDAQRGVQELDAKVGRTPDLGSDQLAAALASKMRAAGGHRIDAVVMSDNAANTFAVQGRLDDPAHLRVVVPTMVAMATPIGQSSREGETQASAPQLIRDDPIAEMGLGARRL